MRLSGSSGSMHKVHLLKVFILIKKMFSNAKIVEKCCYSQIFTQHNNCYSRKNKILRSPTKEWTTSYTVRRYTSNDHKNLNVYLIEYFIYWNCFHERFCNALRSTTKTEMYAWYVRLHLFEKSRFCLFTFGSSWHWKCQTLSMHNVWLTACVYVYTQYIVVLSWKCARLWARHQHMQEYPYTI